MTRIPPRPRPFRMSRSSMLFLANTPPKVPIHSETIGTPSDISCNFTYDSEDVDLITVIAAALAILVVSIQNDYDLCVICTDRLATMKTTSCNHKLLCTHCYIEYCLKKSDPKCPICRGTMDVDDPFALS